LWKRIALGLAITAAVMWIYIKLAGVDLGAFCKVPLYAVVASVALSALSDAVRAFRLKLLTKGVGEELSLKDSLLVWEASRLLAALTPGFYGGEVLRISTLSKKFGINKSIAVNVLETTSEAVAIGVNSFVAFAMLWLGGFKVNVAPLIFPVLMGVAQALGGSLVPALNCPKALKGKARELCEGIREAISLAGYGTFGLAVLVSTVGVALYVMSFGVIASALERAGTVGTLVFASALPLTAIPITPGGVGLPESACTLAYPKLAESLAVWRIINLTSTVLASTASLSLLGLLSSTPSLPRGLLGRGSRPSRRTVPSEP